MKKLFPLLCLAVFVGAGCASRPVNTARELGLIDTLPESASKGYVEFSMREATGPVAIYLVDEEKNSHLLSAIGVDAGDRYYARQGMKVSERLRVAAPAGTHTFSIQKGGPQIEVPVQADRITRVEVDYVPLDRAEAFDIYQLNYAVLDPVSRGEAVGSAPRSE